MMTENTCLALLLKANEIKPVTCKCQSKNQVTPAPNWQLILHNIAE
jgi:hypothetical protein